MSVCEHRVAGRLPLRTRWYLPAVATLRMRISLADRAGALAKAATVIGPTVVLLSAGMRPDANTERWTPSATTLNAASITARLG